MKAQQLKNAILQLAIQGKLVPQDPNDEPASVLFEKIQAEKEKLIAEGKIKKTKKTSDKRPLDVEADFPFEIPDSWKWVTLENILYQLTDGTHATPRYTSSGVPFISVKDISNGKLSFENTKYISLEEHFELSKRCKPEKGDILLSKVGTTGIPVAVNTNIEFSIFVSIALLKLFPTLIFSNFLIYAIQSPLVQLQAKANTRGVGNKNWVLSSIGRTIIPLPPLNEQKRIVAKIEELLPFINEYDKKEQKLTTLNQQFPDQLKKSILQAAIQGQLVAQDPNDEPASELIKRIQAEKERLISEKKIKKPKVKSEIAVRNGLPYEIINGVERCISDELPFEIPESWCWVRLGNIGILTAGKTPSNDKLSKHGNIPYFKVSDMNSIGNEVYLVNTELFLFNSSYIYPKNSIVFPKNGGALLTNKKRILSRDSMVDLNTGVFIPSSHIDVKYLYLLFLTIDFKKIYKGTALPTLDYDKLNNLLIGIPPLNEQKRIVQKIEEVFSHIQSL
jgi:type I site-specific deoxyribonuclease specificity subunit